MSIGFSPSGARRVAAATRWVENNRRGPPGIAGERPSPAEAILVRCDSATADADGNYPCTPLLFDQDGGAGSYRYFDAGKLRMTGGAVPEVGKFYLAVECGRNSADLDVYHAGATTSGGGAGGTILVEEVDLLPQIYINRLSFDQNDGFDLTEVGANWARLDISGATYDRAGIVTLVNQTWKGNKTVQTVAGSVIESSTLGAGFLEVKYDDTNPVSGNQVVSRLSVSELLIGGEDYLGCVISPQGNGMLLQGYSGGAAALLTRDDTNNVSWFEMIGVPGFDNYHGYAIREDGNTRLGIWGTGGGGDTIKGGIVTALGTGPAAIDGGTF